MKVREPSFETFLDYSMFFVGKVFIWIIAGFMSVATGYVALKVDNVPNVAIILTIIGFVSCMIGFWKWLMSFTFGSEEHKESFYKWCGYKLRENSK